MKERRPSGEPVLAEVGPPVILSLDVAGYFSVGRTAKVEVALLRRPRNGIVSEAGCCLNYVA
jgi:hypothetical protein